MHCPHAACASIEASQQCAFVLGAGPSPNRSCTRVSASRSAYEQLRQNCSMCGVAKQPFIIALEDGSRRVPTLPPRNQVLLCENEGHRHRAAYLPWAEDAALEHLLVQSSRCRAIMLGGLKPDVANGISLRNFALKRHNLPHGFGTVLHTRCRLGTDNDSLVVHLEVSGTKSGAHNMVVPGRLQATRRRVVVRAPIKYWSATPHDALPCAMPKASAEGEIRCPPQGEPFCNVEKPIPCVHASPPTPALTRRPLLVPCLRACECCGSRGGVGSAMPKGARRTRHAAECNAPRGAWLARHPCGRVCGLPVQ